MRPEATILAGLLAAAGLAAAPAQAAGVFSNINRLDTTQCLDSATENDSKLQLWHCDGGNDEQWMLLPNGVGEFNFVNQRTGRCAQSPSAWGQAVTLVACDAQVPSQQWVPVQTANEVSATKWLNVASQYCLWAQSTNNGSVLVLGNCEAADEGLFWHKQ